jgi:hypothetical protein
VAVGIFSGSSNVKGDTRLAKDYASMKAKWKRIFSGLSAEEMLAVCDAIVPESFDKHICENVLSSSITYQECEDFHNYMRRNGYDREVSYRLYVWWKYWKYWCEARRDDLTTASPLIKRKES